MADPVDIYDRLREQAQVSPRVREKDSLMLEAADTIAELRAEGVPQWRFDEMCERVQQVTAERDAALARVAELEAGLREIADVDRTGPPSLIGARLDGVRTRARSLLAQEGGT